MQALFRRLCRMQNLAEQDTKDKRMHQKVQEKIQTFLNDHISGETPSRDDAARLLDDIASDLEGDDTERTYIVQKCVQLRADHGLTEDLTDPIRDFAAFDNGLNMLMNAKDYAHEKHDITVSSLKKPTAQQEVVSIAAINPANAPREEESNELVADPLSLTILPSCDKSANIGAATDDREVSLPATETAPLLAATEPEA